MTKFIGREFAYFLLSIRILNWLGARIFLTLRKFGFHFGGFVFPFRGSTVVDCGQDIRFKMLCGGKDTIASRIHQGGIDAFEPEVRPVFERLVARSSLFFDIGANTGFYSLLAAASNPKCKVIAFEPLPSAREFLEKNIALNAFDNVHAESRALSDQNKEGSFFVPKSVRIATGGSERPTHSNPADRIVCKFIRLDDFMSQEHSGSVNLIKMDTEGTEPLVVAGGMGTISKFRPVVITEILNDDLALGLEDQFKALNYKFFQIRPGGLKPLDSLSVGGRGIYWNFLIVPQEKTEQIADLILQ